jgi:hypothetical protein
VVRGQLVLDPGGVAFVPFGASRAAFTVPWSELQAVRANAVAAPWQAAMLGGPRGGIELDSRAGVERIVLPRAHVVAAAIEDERARHAGAATGA